MIFVNFADTRLVIYTVRLQVSMKLCPYVVSYVLLKKTLKGDTSEEWFVIGLNRIARPFLNNFFHNS